MRRETAARILMTIILMGGSILSFALDWSPNHLLNPLWHPHARFHGALLLFLLAGVSTMGTWLLWRRSKELDLAFKITASISLAYWTPLFYIPYLLPSSTWWAGRSGAEPRVGGIAIYPNLIVAAIFVLATILAYWMSRSRQPELNA
jgi:hypothetical protein